MNIYFQIEKIILDPFKKKIKEEILSRLKIFDDFDLLNDLMLDLVKEGKISRYYISKKLDGSNVGIKSVTITSSRDFDYKIGFENITEDYRDFRLKGLLLSDKKNKYGI